ncbi:MAG TPA: hypothetical protein VFI84_00065 [Candidatus Saccharimonadales bacterium]|nr:hypothetical protein [Candidatus Saccharimonadales bacterium]
MKLSIKDIPARVTDLLEPVKKYAVILFVIVVAGVYAFLVFRVNGMQSASPSSSGDTQKGTVVATPRIDPGLVNQLQQLQDNSVSVKSLFDEARSNPFQE